MKMISNTSNTCVVDLNGVLILFSYNIPVACRIDDENIVSVTKKHHSITTAKHINEWTAGFERVDVDQSFLDFLVERIGIV